MKIAKCIRDAYDANLSKYERLSLTVRDRLKPKVEERNWFFSERVKMIDSFALKIETGRIADISAMEDFFACTVIVPTLRDLEVAEELVTSYYSLESRRPHKDGITHKDASDFPFDDIRLYVRHKPSPDGRSSDLDSLIFEVQVKTVLQYAWGIATHQLVYKTDEVSWPKERIAYQIKAMLEHAELAIAEAENLSSASAVSKQNQKTKDILKIIEQLRAVWRDDLPSDLKRLAENVASLLKAVKVNPEHLTSFVEAEKKRIGLLPRDLSPYAFIVQAAAHQVEDFEKNFNRSNVRVVLVIHDGMDLPEWMKAEHKRIINLTPPRMLDF